MNQITTLHLVERKNILDMGTMTVFPSSQAKQNYDHPLEIRKLHKSNPTCD